MRAISFLVLVLRIKVAKMQRRLGEGGTWDFRLDSCRLDSCNGVAWCRESWFWYVGLVCSLWFCELLTGFGE